MKRQSFEPFEYRPSTDKYGWLREYEESNRRAPSAWKAIAVLIAGILGLLAEQLLTQPDTIEQIKSILSLFRLKL